MIVSMISIFDMRQGPKVLLKVPENSYSQEIENTLLKVPLLMDFFKNGFFIHEDPSMKTANIIFNIRSPTSRGNCEQLMLSVVSINENFSINLSTFREIMEFFVDKFQNIKDPIHTLYSDTLELQELLNSLYQALPDDRAISKNVMSQMVTFGLSPNGKTAILRMLQEKFDKVNTPIDRLSFNRDIDFSSKFPI